jgi:hypothetical protein
MIDFLKLTLVLKHDLARLPRLVLNTWAPLALVFRISGITRLMFKSFSKCLSPLLVRKCCTEALNISKSAPKSNVKKMNHTWGVQSKGKVSLRKQGSKGGRD